MSSPTIDVSIIIVNYHTSALVKACIKSIIKLKQDVRYEVIVVDNHTEDLSALKALSVNIRVLQLDENLGFGRANNEGAKVAQGNILFFLNPDTILVNNAVDILFEAMEKEATIGVCGGNLLTPDKQPMHSYYDVTMSIPYALKDALLPTKRLHQISQQYNMTSMQKDVGYITGADLMIRKGVFQKVGGFNDKIFMYYEDVDLCYKVKTAGYQICSVPQAQIIHLEGSSMNGATEKEKAIKRASMNAKSQAIFLADHYSHWKALLILNIFLCSQKMKKIIKNVAKKNSSDNEQQIRHFQDIKTNYQLINEEESIN